MASRGGRLRDSRRHASLFYFWREIRLLASDVLMPRPSGVSLLDTDVDCRHRKRSQDAHQPRERYLAGLLFVFCAVIITETFMLCFTALRPLSLYQQTTTYRLCPHFRHQSHEVSMWAATNASNMAQFSPVRQAVCAMLVSPFKPRDIRVDLMILMTGAHAARFIADVTPIFGRPYGHRELRQPQVAPPSLNLFNRRDIPDSRSTARRADVVDSDYFALEANRFLMLAIIDGDLPAH